MAEKRERPHQLVAVVLASYNQANRFVEDAQKAGHDGYAESSPQQALNTLRTQTQLYSANAFIVDVTRIGGTHSVDGLKEFFDQVRGVSPEVPVFAYSSEQRKGRLMRTLAAFGAVDAVLRGQEINPEAVMDAYPRAVKKRKNISNSLRVVA